MILFIEKIFNQNLHVTIPSKIILPHYAFPLPLLKKQPQIPTCINSPYRGQEKNNKLTISFGKEVRLKTQKFNLKLLNKMETQCSAN